MMNISILKISLGVLFTTFSVNAIAQKSYNEGIINYTMTAPVGSTETKVYFNADSNALVTDNGQYTAKIVSDNKNSFVAILVDVPMISLKKVAVLAANEIAQVNSEIPGFTFTATGETKQINGYNCKKVIAKDAKSGTNVELWVTDDISAPANSVTKPFVKAGGVPVKFTTVQQGQTVNVELKSIAAIKVPAGTFGVPAGYEKISFAELKALGGQ